MFSPQVFFSFIRSSEISPPSSSSSSLSCFNDFLPRPFLDSFLPSFRLAVLSMSFIKFQDELSVIAFVASSSQTSFWRGQASLAERSTEHRRLHLTTGGISLRAFSFSSMWLKFVNFTFAWPIILFPLFEGTSKITYLPTCRACHFTILFFACGGWLSAFSHSLSLSQCLWCLLMLQLVCRDRNFLPSPSSRLSPPPQENKAIVLPLHFIIRISAALTFAWQVVNSQSWALKIIKIAPFSFYLPPLSLSSFSVSVS